MQRDTPPPIGYYISDYEIEIRNMCSFFEKDGMKYELVNEFQICYTSNTLILNIIFERYGETVWVNYKLPDDGFLDEYSVNWTLFEYKNGELRKKYLNVNADKLKIIEGYINFFKDYRSLFFDEIFAKKMKAKYEKIGI
jgi:hypothetical protein